MTSVLEKLQAILSFYVTANQLQPVQGFLTDFEGLGLNLLAQHGPGKGAIVEIGSFMGRSTCWLALGSKAAAREPVFAVDHFKGSPEHQPGQAVAVAELETVGTTFHQFQNNIAKMDVAEQVYPVQAESAEAAAKWRGPIRLLFVDGEHSYEAVKRDVELWSPFVVPGGIVALHDVHNAPDVTQYFEELKQPGAGFTELFRIHSLGVLRKN